MSLIISIMLYMIVTFSGSVPDSDRYYLCNGLEINNTDHAAVSEYSDPWIIHFAGDSSLEYTIIFDTCFFEYRAYDVSPTGIEKVEF